MDSIRNLPEEQPVFRNYSEELAKIIRSGISPRALKDRLSDYHQRDIAEVLEELPPAHCAVVEAPDFTGGKFEEARYLLHIRQLLAWARELQCPVVVHVKTVKGRGYSFAEQNPDKFHGVGPFDPETGLVKKSGGDDFSAVFGRTLAACAAMTVSIVRLAEPVVSFLSELRQLAGLEPALLQPLLRTVGIGLLTQLTASVCADAGESTVARLIELCGSVLGIYTALPLLEAVLSLLRTMLEG